MTSKRIQIQTGDQPTDAYLSLPKGGGPGVIVLQEWWGLVPHIEDVCDRFAQAGFVALAPDLYGGQTTTEPEEAGSLMMALRIPETEKTLAAAIRALLADPNTSSTQVGVVGFCMGGQLAMYAACANQSVGACVNFYGIHPEFKPNFETLHAPLLGLFGDKDPMTTPAVVDELSKKLTELGKPHEFHSYPADHAFFNDERPEVYHQASAEDAWNRCVKHFRENLS